MTKNKGKTPTGGAGYEVGYARPPLHSRFRPGQSGNPAGRRKGAHNLGTDVQRILCPFRMDANEICVELILTRN